MLLLNDAKTLAHASHKHWADAMWVYWVAVWLLTIKREKFQYTQGDFYTD